MAHTSDPAGQLYDCPVPGGGANPACKQYTGAYIMDSLGFPSRWVIRPIIVLVAFVVAFVLGSGLILRFWKVGIGISTAREDDTDHSASIEKMASVSPDDVRTIDIRLSNYSLDIRKRRLKPGKTAELSILKPLNIDFEPGKLNIIMG